jgi:hypothetical protein
MTRTRPDEVYDFVLHQFKTVFDNNPQVPRDLLWPCCEVAAEEMERICPVALATSERGGFVGAYGPVVGRDEVVVVVAAVNDGKRQSASLHLPVAEFVGLLPEARERLKGLDAYAGEPVSAAGIWHCMVDFIDPPNAAGLLRCALMTVIRNNPDVIREVQYVRSEFQLTPVLAVLISKDSGQNRITGTCGAFGLPRGIDEQLKRMGVE